MKAVAILALVVAAPFWQASILWAQSPAANTVSDASSRAPLVGLWVQESSSAVTYSRIDLLLRADGSYTKRLLTRTPMMTGGQLGSGPSIGGTHSGTWTAYGTIVHLSGDGNWPAYQHDLRLFTKRQ